MVFYFGLKPAVDPDYGWHIANGGHVLDGATLGGTDIYSWTASGLWVAHEWLAELGMFAVHKTFGLTGNSIFAAVIVTVTYATVARRLIRLEAGWRTTLIALPICFVGGMRSIAVRPLVLELLYLSFALYALDLYQRGAVKPRALVAGACVFALIWANTHGSFPLLVAVLVLASVELKLDGDARWKWTSIAALVSAISFLANPWTTALYGFAFQSLRSSPTLAYIEEWQRPDPFSAQGLPLLIQLILVFIGIFATWRKRASWRGVIVALAFVYLALTSGRHVVLLGIAGAPMIAKGISFVLPFRRDADADADWRKGAINIAAAFLVAIAVVAAGWRVVSPEAQNTAEAKHYPADLLPVISGQLRPSDHLFNEYRWGGYLIRRNVLPVFIDGRSELYGDALLNRYASVVHLEHGWQDTLSRLGVNVILMPSQSRLATALPTEDWSIVATDSVATLFRRQQAK